MKYKINDNSAHHKTTSRDTLLVGRVNVVLCYIEFEENNQESRSPLWSREQQTSAAAADGTRLTEAGYAVPCSVRPGSSSGT